MLNFTRKTAATTMCNSRIICKDCAFAVDRRRRNGISVGGYSKAPLWHTLELRSAATFPS